MKGHAIALECVRIARIFSLGLANIQSAMPKSWKSKGEPERIPPLNDVRLDTAGQPTNLPSITSSSAAKLGELNRQPYRNWP